MDMRRVGLATAFLKAILACALLMVALGVAGLVSADAEARFGALRLIFISGAGIPFWFERLQVMRAWPPPSPQTVEAEAPSRWVWLAVAIGLIQVGEEAGAPSRRVSLVFGLGFALGGAIDLVGRWAILSPVSAFDFVGDLFMIAVGATAIVYDPWRRGLASRSTRGSDR